MSTAAPRERTGDALHWSACALLLAVVVFGLCAPLLTLGRFIPLDSNEGWNAYFGDAAMRGAGLYPPADALITNNYPPLSFYIVGAVGHLFGDNILAGRAIALLSMLFVAWSIYYWLRISGSAQRIGLLGAVSFLAYAVTYGREYVAMDDPQWLAHALMMAGLLVLWKHKDDSWHLILAAVLMVAAGWTKHLLVPLPAAISLWLLLRSRSDFGKWMLALTVTLAIACGLTYGFLGGRMFESLREPRQYLRHQALGHSAAALRCFAPLVILWMLGWVENAGSERLRFVSLYLLIAGALAVLAAGGAGVDVNAFFDLLIAATLGASLGVETLSRRQRSQAASAGPSVWGPAATLALAVCVLGYTLSIAPEQIQRIRSVAADEQAARRDIALISATSHGHAACESLALCYWAGSRFMVDFFYFGQELKTGVLPQSACADVFEHDDISLVQLDPIPSHRAKLLPDYCNAAIGAWYHPIRQSSLGLTLIPPGSRISHNR